MAGIAEAHVVVSGRGGGGPRVGAQSPRPAGGGAPPGGARRGGERHRFHADRPSRSGRRRNRRHLATDGGGVPWFRNPLLTARSQRTGSRKEMRRGAGW